MKQMIMAEQSNKLTSLPNIGKVIAARLREAGIETPGDLKAIGSENAFIRLKTMDEGACINELLGLEGAVQGIRDHDLEESRKAGLKAFYKMTKINDKNKSERKGVFCGGCPVTESIAMQFNDYINNQNLNGLVNLMTDNHIFIDSANNRIAGKSNNEANWRTFFELFPGYRNIFETVSSADLTVIMRGYSVCPDDRLNNTRAIWVARIAGDKVDEWHVYFDTEENRKSLEI